MKLKEDLDKANI